jgi:hypothetical protein
VPYATPYGPEGEGAANVLDYAVRARIAVGYGRVPHCVLCVYFSRPLSPGLAVVPASSPMAYFRRNSANFYDIKISIKPK